MRQYYFAYGSNMDSRRMKKRGVHVSRRVPASASGYRLEFNKIASCNPKQGYANIVPDERETVEGILYEIAVDNMSTLDGYEGYPKHYDRIEISVTTREGDSVNALVYVAQSDKLGKGLLPTREYLGHLLAGADILPGDYCEKLRAVETLF